MKAGEDAPEESIVEVRDLVRDFSGRRVLDGISFSVRRGEILVIMGAHEMIPGD